jgi:hypothetical protein
MLGPVEPPGRSPLSEIHDRLALPWLLDGFGPVASPSG